MPAPPLSDLVDLMNEATDAYIKGETRHYLSLFGHPAECSLMPSYGGEAMDHLRHDDEAMSATSAFFASGEGHFDLQHLSRPVTSSSSRASNDSTARLAACPTRTGRCASPSSSGARAMAGSCCTVMPTHSSGRFPSSAAPS
jgi:hypothetical protein